MVPADSHLTHCWVACKVVSVCVRLPLSFPKPLSGPPPSPHLPSPI